LFNGGNVGIGTTSPTEKLDVAGNIYLQNVSTGRRDIRGTMADNDFWSIGANSTGSNAGVLEIATGDDGQATGSAEPIVVRQYGPGSPWSGTLVRTAYLLDAYGYSSFPGNVGIGTTSPAAKLHISAGDGSLALFGPNSTWGGKLFVGAAPNQNVASTAQVISTDGNLHLDPAPSKNMYLGYYQARDIYINPNGGNVGIGTTGPSTQLHTTGGIRFQSLTGTGTRFVMTDANGNLSASSAPSANIVSGNGVATRVAFWSDANTLSSNANLYWDNSNNRLGIGTSSPAQGKLWVQGGDIWTTGDNSKLAFSTDGSTDNIPNASIIASQNGISGSSADLLFNTWNGASNVEIMRVRSNGNVGIGTTNPSIKLEVRSDGTGTWQGRMGLSNATSDKQVFFGNYGSIAGVFAHNFALNAWADLYVNTVSGTTGMVVKGDGNVGIGTASPSFKAHIAQDISMTGDIDPGSGQLALSGATSPGKRMIMGYDQNGNGFGYIKAGNYGVSWTNLALQPNGGNVGIGTTSPAQKLDVNGNIKFLNSLNTPQISNITPIFIRGTGLNNNSNRIVRIGNTEVANNGSRGLTLVILNKSDHSVVSTTNYDTYGDPAASNNLATALIAINNGQIGMLTSFDAWEGQITSNLQAAFKRLGLYKALMTTVGGSRRPYCAIFEGSSSSSVPSASAIEIEHSSDGNEPYAEMRGWLINGSYDVTNQVPSGLATPIGDYAVGVNENGNVGVGTTSPAASAKLDVSSTTQGFLPPRMTESQRNAISSPAAGLIIFNSTSGCLNYYSGSAWMALCGDPPYTPGSQTFNYTGAQQTFTVPAGVTTISVDARGGQGYGCSTCGYGGRVQCNYSVTPGQTLYVYVGGMGTETTGGFNGGGTGGSNDNYAGGGGASDIRSGGTALGNRIIVAGGGGGSGSNCGQWTAEGGLGGGLTGGSGCVFSCSDCQYTGSGGTQSAGGIAGPTSHGSCTDNHDGTLGNGGSNTGGYGTGGGGGYYGGGSGCFEGAGGGSSYTGTGASGVTHTQGYQSGNGQVIISW